jgi:glycolate oxidase iron-sulfur subunit
MTGVREQINNIAAICSDCGNCLHACPVYNSEFIEPNAPRGKINLIKALLDGRLIPNSLNKNFISHCLLCGSCEHICTNDVDFVDIMIKYRNLASKGDRIPFLKKLILFFYQSILIKKFSFVIDIFYKTPLKKFFLIPRRRPASLKKILTKKGNKKAYDVLLFPGCVLTYFYPKVTIDIHAYLEKKGFSVVVPKGLKCCGFPYLSQGWHNKFVNLKRDNSELFSQFKYEYLVVPCGTGVMTFNKFYELKDIQVHELTDFFYRFLKESVQDIPGKPHKTKKKITWHDPCHSLKSLNLEKEPRFFMKAFGDKFIDDKSALCCGFGGIFSLGFPKTSKRILNRKAENLSKLGAHQVVTSCPGCYMHLQENLSQDVKFFIELFKT